MKIVINLTVEFSHSIKKKESRFRSPARPYKEEVKTHFQEEEFESDLNTTKTREEK